MTLKGPTFKFLIVSNINMYNQVLSKKGIKAFLMSATQMEYDAKWR